MGVTIMEKTMWLVKKLKNRAKQHPQLSRLVLKKGEMFGWDHTACVIFYNPRADGAEYYLLHEFGHALLQHTGFLRDIDLLKMERAAWDEAQKLGSEYGIDIPTDSIEDALDTYRDWLHSRSICPECEATGIQIAPYLYRCTACRGEWRVNEARTCNLRRYITKKRPV